MKRHIFKYITPELMKLGNLKMTKTGSQITFISWIQIISILVMMIFMIVICYQPHPSSTLGESILQHWLFSS